jgi:regulation of enolase protein 1 (concanavalin A-like superfamily)
MISMDLTGWTWLNEPRKWSADPLTVHADGDTDFWRLTSNNVVRDSGHLYGVPLTGDFTLTATFSGDFATQYDQAGIGLLADDENWIKAGVEMFDGEVRASTVVTRGFSDWSLVSTGAFERFTVSAHREGNAVWVRYGTDGGEPVTLMRHAYFPPEVEVKAGIMVAAPVGEGFVTQFHEVQVTR